MTSLLPMTVSVTANGTPGAQFAEPAGTVGPLPLFFVSLVLVGLLGLRARRNALERAANESEKVLQRPPKVR